MFAEMRTGSNFLEANLNALAGVTCHGEVFNPEGVLYGRLPDYHLSDRGRAMADRAAEALAGRDIARVVASPLDRAQETAAPIAAVHGLEIVTDPRVIEADNVFEGQRIGDAGLGPWLRGQCVLDIHDAGA